MITFSDGTQLTANEWSVFRQCVELMDHIHYQESGFFPDTLFQMRSRPHAAGRRTVLRLADKGLLKRFYPMKPTLNIFTVSDKGWACWKERR